MGVAKLCRLLTGGVTPTRCKSLNQAVQMVRCELCMPTVVVLEMVLHVPPSSFFISTISHDLLSPLGKNGNNHKP